MRYSTKKTALLCITILLGALGQCGILNPLDPYKPVITLSAIFTQDSVYLPGNRWYPNTCTMVADTLRMYMYSEEYTQNPNGSMDGDQFRLDVYNPFDTLIGIRGVLLRVIRYSVGTQPAASYVLSPADTIRLPEYDISIRMIRFSRRAGDSVAIDIISAHPKFVATAPDLRISHGTIRGVMQ